MKQLILLTKIYCMELFGINKKAHMPGKRTGRRASGFTVWTLCILAVIGILAFSGAYCTLAAFGMKQVGLLHLYPGLVMALTCLMDLILTITRASEVLVKTKDYDIVTSLPIPGWALAASRVIRLYLFNLASTAVIAIPAGVCYGLFAKASVWFYPMYLILTVLAPLLPVALAAFIGSIIASISAAAGNNKTLRTLLSFAFPIVVLYFSMRFSANTSDDAALINMLTNISNVINRIWITTGMYTRACVDLDVLALLEFAAISVGAFALFCVFYGRMYVKINSMTDVKKTRRHTAKIEGARSAGMALYEREIRRYFSSTLYVTNTAFAGILSLIGVIALSIVGMDKFAVLFDLPGVEEYIVAVLPMVLAMLAGMGTTTASSISMEGKSLWICRTLPIPAFRWLMAKLLLSLSICVPFCLLDAVILTLAMHLSAGAFLMMVCIPMCFGVFMSLLGLCCNIRFHKLDWTNEATVIKQSMPVLIQVLISMFLPMGLVVLMGYLGGAWLTWMPWVFAGAGILISAIILIVLKNRAEKIMRNL